MDITRKNMQVWENYHKKRDKSLLWPAEELMAFYRNYIQKENPSNVLDIGCGLGRNLWYLGEQGLELYGIDSSKSAVKFAGRYLTKRGLESKIIVGNSNNLPYKNKYFGMVVVWGLFHYLSDEDAIKTKKEILRVLNPRGWFLGTLRSIYDEGYKQGKILNKGRIINNKKDRENIVIKYYNKKELEDFCEGFSESYFGHAVRTPIGKKQKAHWLFGCRL